MKEPHEIYWDELSREVKRRSKGSLPTEEQLLGAEQAAAEAVAYHLVEQLHFSVEEAVDVVEEFRSARLDQEALRHTWTDIVLRRARDH